MHRINYIFNIDSFVHICLELSFDTSYIKSENWIFKIFKKKNFIIWKNQNQTVSFYFSWILVKETALNLFKQCVQDTDEVRKANWGTIENMANMYIIEEEKILWINQNYV